MTTAHTEQPGRPEPAAGQRWRDSRGVILTLGERGERGTKYRRDVDGGTGELSDVFFKHPDVCYLGGPANPPSTQGVVAGQRRIWTGRDAQFGPFVVEAHGNLFVGNYESGEGRTSGMTAAYIEPQSTLLPATPVTSGVPGPTKSEAPTVHFCPTDDAPEASEVGYSRVGNVTALQLIAARKPPEPWRPTVDEFDLLPDAYGVTK